MNQKQNTPKNEVNFLPKHNPKFSTDLYFLKMDQLEEDYPR